MISATGIGGPGRGQCRNTVSCDVSLVEREFGMA